MERVQQGELKLRGAAEMMNVGYRQAKRLWRRYGKEGEKGLVHGSVGRSNRSKPRQFRAKVLRVVRSKYGGEAGERFGPTLAAEHLAADDGLVVVSKRSDGGCWRKGCGAGNESGKRIGSEGSGGSTSENWCRWTGAFTCG